MTKRTMVEEGCPNCKSSDIVKSGVRKNRSGKKQRYACNKCNSRFVIDDGFKGAHFAPEIITRAMHEYADSGSLSKVRNHLFQHDRVKVSDASIIRWIKKYATILKKDYRS